MRAHHHQTKGLCMLINIKGTDVDTRDIVAIKEAGFRTHGFIVHLTDNRTIAVTQREQYDMTPMECCAINDRYRTMKDEIIKYWNQDKRDVPVIGL